MSLLFLAFVEDTKTDFQNVCQTCSIWYHKGVHEKRITTFILALLQFYGKLSMIWIAD